MGSGPICLHAGAEWSLTIRFVNGRDRNINEEGTMSRLFAIVVWMLALAGAVHAQSRAGKGIRLWNLTTATMSGFHLSPAGQDRWTANLTLADKDREVDHDERLRITGIEPGRYDAKVSYPDGRQCMVRNIEIKPDAVFDIADKDLEDCKR